ncbi:MAG: Molybdenum cofactor synthesis domain protein [Thermotoga sp. 50_1627]|uniref:molybdopterin molybdotransferase MoeA n=1 Tax=Pseudothermotoga sp. TaxID=2033661 RepID=UPI00076BFB2F|nr:MAG: Molybdenum cofactor synthesis domain protein [Thermotoga sp. 50_64]KUK25258.1 MAG: Molybdenum cofactor synthesis domain protein [Thermotoga sp. 50_1627]MBC7116290.1 molybdopterin molybdotransferase MoeA [Pseudothermotoga sp.]MDK2922713.1 molybdopterin molybdotransferase [Pseudothermotoga sp.]HBT38686.1 molybdopterin molybdenumtransferase MoeA [Pseudothermotoga sp.]
MKFLKLASLDQVYSEYLRRLQPIGETLEVSTTESLGFVCARNVIASQDLPGFNKSLVDGYAVRSKDTTGASANFPVMLRVVFEVKVGEEPSKAINENEAAWVATGAMLPEGADAVVMVEHTQRFNEYVEVMKPVAIGENVLRTDEDVRKGQLVLAEGERIHPGHLQLLLQLGVERLKVFRRARVGVISTGDEIVEPFVKEKSAVQVRDSNSYGLVGWLKSLGFEASRVGLCKDSEDELFRTLRSCFDEYDVLVVSGGSSIGVRDFTEAAINRLGKPGVLFHGILIQPGKPTVLAIVNDKPVVGLPGNPVSFTISAKFVLIPILRKLENEKDFLFKPSGMVKLTRNVSSRQGREQFVRVKLLVRNGQVWAEPLESETARVFNLVEAHGVIRVPSDVEGLCEGELTEFYSLWSGW